MVNLHRTGTQLSSKWSDNGSISSYLNRLVEAMTPQVQLVQPLVPLHFHALLAHILGRTCLPTGRSLNQLRGKRYAYYHIGAAR